MTHITDSQPVVTVIIPTYNRAELLRRCLASLESQTFKRFEVVVCDDGSTDDTAAVVNDFTDSLDLTYVALSNSGGPATPRNAGLSAAKGEFVAFLDSDDWWKPRKLERSVRELCTGADLVYHSLNLRTEANSSWRFSRIRASNLGNSPLEKLLTRGNSIPNSSVVARRALVEQVGGFDSNPDLVAAEDFDLWLRLAAAGAQLRRLRHADGCYWVAPGNLSSALRMQRNLDALLRKYPQMAEPHMPAWVLYARGVAHLRLGDKQQALASLRCITFRTHLRRDPKIWAKANARKRMTELILIKRATRV